MENNEYDRDLVFGDTDIVYITLKVKDKVNTMKLVKEISKLDGIKDVLSFKKIESFKPFKTRWGLNMSSKIEKTNKRIKRCSGKGE